MGNKNVLTNPPGKNRKNVHLIVKNHFQRLTVCIILYYPGGALMALVPNEQNLKTTSFPNVLFQDASVGFDQPLMEAASRVCRTTHDTLIR